MKEILEVNRTLDTGGGIVGLRKSSNFRIFYSLDELLAASNCERIKLAESMRSQSSVVRLPFRDFRIT